jgi:hypothetical protein
MIGAVGVLFPAGLLPSNIPFGATAAGLALLLASWCHGAGEQCREARDTAPNVSPSVEHPGVPRTNEDGSWPRRPPGRQ